MRDRIGGRGRRLKARIGRARYNLLRKSVDVEVDGRTLHLGGFSFFRSNVFAAEEFSRCINALARFEPTGDT